MQVTQNLTTDYHCHLLPGLDDGPSSIDESVEMARLLSAAGYKAVCCTSHCIRGVYDNTAERVRSATRELQTVLETAAIPLTLVPAFEYYLDEFLLDLLRDPLPLPDNLVLVELATQGDPSFITETLYQVIRKGFTPLIAHPERCKILTRELGKLAGKPGIFGFVTTLIGAKEEAPEQTLKEDSLIARLQRMGCKFQGNLGSFSGFYGYRVKGNAEQLRRAGLYTHFGSDLHSVRQKEVLLIKE